VLPIGYVGLLLLLDQLTKWLAGNHLAPLYAGWPPRDNVLISGLLRLTYLENSGMAFGIMQGGRWLLVPLTVIVIGILIYFYITTPKTRLGKWYQFTLLTLTGGALGNFVDRVFNNGYVIDFIVVEFFPFVFNVADIFIVVSVIVLIVLTIFMKDEKGKKVKSK